MPHAPRRRLPIAIGLVGGAAALIFAFILATGFGSAQAGSTTVVNDTDNTVVVELVQPPGASARPLLYVIEPHASKLIAGGTGLALYRVTDQAGAGRGCLAIDFTGKTKASGTRYISSTPPCPSNVPGK